MPIPGADDRTTPNPELPAAPTLGAPSELSTAPSVEPPFEPWEDTPGAGTRSGTGSRTQGARRDGVRASLARGGLFRGRSAASARAALRAATRSSAKRFRAIRTQRPFTARRLVSALSRASVLLLAVVLTAAASTVSPIGTRRTARDAAARELSALLEPGERVEAQAFASQRRASDVWRLSHGVVAATDRRVVYVAAPPFPLLRPRDDGPRELYLEEWSYASAFALDWDSDVTGGRVLALRAPARQALLRVESGDVRRAEQVLAAAAAARRAATDEMARLDRTSRLPAPMPTRYVVHVVRRGESLSLLARSYNTSVDILRQLNGLADDRVRIGQRLRVPERIDDTDPFDTLLLDSMNFIP